ncbi:MAG: DUF424 family protein [archaeon]|nr:DUF424 family protein [archaeon]
MIYIKVHGNRNSRVLAACDEDVLGKVFEGNGVKLTVSKNFYGGELVSEKIFVEYMKSSTTMNFVGKKTIFLAVKNGYVSKDCVVKIGNAEHAQAVKL